ncbi:O-acetyl-ADP-ribose deacetylase [Achromobacter sp. 413638]|uniref:O-acetyl-ADP-ribose deacetylase n=1 Tax=Achromobacter sp. 413638 TaxID=3342385 RepID=UPI00370C5D39
MEHVTGDITRMNVDAIVNAAKPSLLGGGGVDGAIHQAAGPGLLAECAKLGGCEVGRAKITAGHRLPARHVIHTVGPVWQGGGNNEAAKLASCYRESIRLAVKKGLGSIAFPAISTGVYGYPRKEAAAIAVAAVRQAMQESEGSSLRRVVFCCYDDEDARLYRQLLSGMRQP